MTDKQIIIDDQKETIHRLQQECTEKTNAIIALGERLKAKEQECEELKEEIKTNGFGCFNIEMSEQLDQLKKTLTEIKEIAKIKYPKSLFTETFVEVINHCPYFDCGNCKCLENKEKQNCGGFICSRKQSVYYQENTIYFKQILQKISEVVE